MNLYDKNVIINLIQIVIIYNAIELGWNIKKIGYRKFQLSKKISELNNLSLKYILSNFFIGKVN